MRLWTTLTIIVVTVGCRRVSSPPIRDNDLALLLAAEGTRPGAIAQIVASTATTIPLLLSWTEKPPAGLGPLEQYQLNIGMAEVFGQLRTREAVPFLLRNLTLNKFPVTNVWTRASDVILERLPCVAALIRIGPEGARAVMEEYRKGRLDVNGRLAAVFIVSRTPSIPEAREFLFAALGEANMLRVRAEEGIYNLENLGKHP